MSRLHLIELHEQPWMPALLRDCITDYLRTATRVAGHYKAVVPMLQRVLDRSEESTILDLCSGAGAGWPEIQPLLATRSGGEVEVVLSDLNPNIPAWNAVRDQSSGNISFEAEPLDARKPERAGIRTMFNAFHHFRPEDARAIVEDADQRRMPFLMVEILEKSWLQGILIVLLSPIMTWLLTPLIRPFRWGRLLFTYLIPIVPLMVAWDGLVSVIRLYSVDELNRMTASLTNMNWDAGIKKEGNLTIMFLEGTPK